MTRLASCGAWCLALAVAAASAPAMAEAPTAAFQNKKPSIKLKANPTGGMAPFRVVVTAELNGGWHDFQEFYCASVEWDWGDGTKSETKEDCDPYEAGKSEIKRRYTQDHPFRSTTGLGTQPFGGGDSSDVSGNQQGVQMRIRFVLKQKDKTVGAGQTTVQVRPGIRDGLD